MYNTVRDDITYNTIIVQTDETSVNVSQPITNVVQITTIGPQGSAGPQGPQGPSGSTFPYTGSASITGSLTVTGSVRATSFTGSLAGTSSYAVQSLSSSYATTANFAENSNFAVSANSALSLDAAGVSKDIAPESSDIIVEYAASSYKGGVFYIRVENQTNFATKLSTLTVLNSDSVVTSSITPTLELPGTGGETTDEFIISVSMASGVQVGGQNTSTTDIYKVAYYRLALLQTPN